MELAIEAGAADPSGIDISQFMRAVGQTVGFFATFSPLFVRQRFGLRLVHPS